VKEINRIYLERTKIERKENEKEKKEKGTEISTT
jgi:hypothetical protein